MYLDEIDEKKDKNAFSPPKKTPKYSLKVFRITHRRYKNHETKRRNYPELFFRVKYDNSKTLLVI